MGISLHSLCLPNGFDGRAELEMDTVHVFPQGVLLAITLVGGGAGDEVSKARARCELGLSLCSLAVSALLWVGSGSKLLEQKPYGSGPSWVSSLSLCFPPPTGLVPSHQRGAVLEQEGLV